MNTFGQLLLELEKCKPDDQDLLKSDLVVLIDGEFHFVQLTVTLPGRKLILIPATEDGS